MLAGMRVRLVLLILLAMATLANAQTRWITSWAAPQQEPESMNLQPAADLNDATIRQVFRLTIGGSAVRVHLSNAFGTEPLHVQAVRLALPGAAPGTTEPATDRAVLFNGAADVWIPAGAEYLSDPLNLSTKALERLTVTLYLRDAPRHQTGHPGAHATTWLAHGDQSSAVELTAAKHCEHWLFVAGVDVAARAKTQAVVAFGDSITDGHGATTDGNDRWPDILANRLQAAGQDVAVLNMGIGGNHMLTDGLGPNALARFDRDVLGQSGVRTVLVLEGINDIGGLTFRKDPPAAEHAAFVARIIASYAQLIERAHAHGLKIVGGTILPMTGSDYYQPPPSNEADRQQLNAWIRSHFDAVIDFDKLMRDPARPDHLLPIYDSGDHLHPNPAGYKAMGELIPLALVD